MLSDPDLGPLAKRPKVAKLLKASKSAPASSLLQLSPFPTDGLGTQQPDATRPSGPGVTF